MKKLHIEIILGTLFTIITVFLIGDISLKEEDKLARSLREQQASQIEFGAMVYEINCTNCHGTYAQGIPGKAPCLRCEEYFDGSRMDTVGWGGSLEDYFFTVVSTGRQVTTRPEYQGEGSGPPVMPTWDEKFGGPLREDQIRGVAAFLANFEEWGLNPELVPTALIPFDPGDPVQVGRAIFIKNGCIGCHQITGLSDGAITGPVLDGIGSRVDEAYIIESILNPSAVIVENFVDDLMPKNFSELITEEELGNLVLFLLSQTD
jgi:mono/diheme cytochrome c family protein